MAGAFCGHASLVSALMQSSSHTVLYCQTGACAEVDQDEMARFRDSLEDSLSLVFQSLGVEYLRILSTALVQNGACFHGV